jgi:hypothetical protein
MNLRYKRLQPCCLNFTGWSGENNEKYYSGHKFTEYEPAVVVMHGVAKITLLFRIRKQLNF